MTSIRTMLVAVDAKPGAEKLIRSYGGELLRSTHLAASFEAPADAVRAAAALIAPNENLAARVGLDTGEPSVAAEIAAQACAAADDGQALATEVVAHLAGAAVSDLLRPAGGVRVAALRRTVPVYAIGQPLPTLAPARQTTVVIADDQALLRAGFRIIIDTEPDLRVVGEAEDGWAAIEIVRRRQPDVVLMDIRMPGLDGLRAAETILSDHELSTAVVILTTFDIQRYVYEALRVGASGFLLKDAPADRLLDAIRVAAAGDALLAPAITRRLIERFTALARPLDTAPSRRLATLTPRELDVLRLIARGQSNTEIAAELVLGANTIKTHVSRIFAKLELRDRTQAVIVAYETGLITPTPDLD